MNKYKLSKKEKECMDCLVKDFKQLSPILQSVILNSKDVEEKYINDGMKKLTGGSIFSNISSLVSKTFRSLVNAPSNIGKAVSRTFHPRLDDYSRKTKAMMDKYGNYTIVKLSIYRAPITEMLNSIINAVSLGQWEQLKKKYGIDKLYHLALVAQIDVNGVQKNLIMEKEEEVKLKDSFPTLSRTDVLDLGMPPKRWTTNKLFQTTMDRVGKHTFFDYDGLTNNCQFFIKYLLETMNMYSKEAKDFLFQDLSDIKKELPSYVQATMKGVTRLGNIVAKLTGQGKPSEMFEKKHSISKDEKEELEKRNDKIHLLINKVNKLSEFEDLRELIKDEVRDILDETRAYKFADVVIDDIEDHLIDALKDKYGEKPAKKNKSMEKKQNHEDLVEQANIVINMAKDRISKGEENIDDLDNKILQIMDKAKGEDLETIQNMIKNLSK